MKGDRELNTKRILGRADTEDNICWDKEVTDLYKLIMAIAYNSTPLKTADFKETLELLANIKTINAAFEYLTRKRYILTKTVYGENYVTAGPKLIQALDPDVEKPQPPYFGATAIDKYNIKTYLLKLNLASFLRGKIKPLWDAKNQEEKDQWTVEQYIKSIVYTSFFALAEKERKSYLYQLPVLSPEDKKTLAESKTYSTKYEELFVRATLKSWKNEKPDEYYIFEKNFNAAIKSDPIAAVRLWRGDLITRETMEGWLIEALCMGVIGILKNHGNYVYDKLLTINNEYAEQMLEYDAYLDLQSYNALTTRRSLKSGNKDIIASHFSDRDSVNANIEAMKKSSKISYAEDVRNSTCLTYKLLSANDCYINQFKKAGGQTYIHFYIVVPGVELSKAIYKKKIDMITRFAKLYDLPYIAEFVCKDMGRSHALEKRLDGILKTLGIGFYDMETSKSQNAHGYMYRFTTYQEARGKKGVLDGLI